MTPSPCCPMLLHHSTSSSAIRAAVSRAADTIAATPPPAAPRTAASCRSTAHLRLAAVGRVRASCFPKPSIASRKQVTSFSSDTPPSPTAGKHSRSRPTPLLLCSKSHLMWLNPPPPPPPPSASRPVPSPRCTASFLACTAAQYIP